MQKLNLKKNLRVNLYRLINQNYEKIFVTNNMVLKKLSEDLLIRIRTSSIENLMKIALLMILTFCKQLIK